MKEPKHNPKEVLDRMKLLMKYDTSKTLNENVQTINEEATIGNTAIGTGTGAALGAGYGAIASTGALGGLGTSVGGGSLAVGTALAPGLGAAGATALGASVIGGAAALALTPLILWYMDKDNAKSKVQRIINYCVSDKDKISKVKREVPETTIRDLSDSLADAMRGVGTNEEQVYNAFKSLKTASDFCALVDRFNKDYGSEGDLLEWLDSDFDATSEWEQIFRPIRNVVEDTLLNIKDPIIEDNCKTNPDDPACKKTPVIVNPPKPGPVTSKFKSCSDNLPIAKWCKNSTVSKVQACIGGIKVDSKFGDQTASAIKNLGFSGDEITQDVIDKACNKTPTVTGTPKTPWQDEEGDTEEL